MEEKEEGDGVDGRCKIDQLSGEIFIFDQKFVIPKYKIFFATQKACGISIVLFHMF